MTGSLQDQNAICPTWCELPADHISPGGNWCLKHIRTVSRIGIPEIAGIRPGSEEPLCVEIRAPINGETHDGPPVIRISLAYSGSEDLTVSEARVLAAALHAATDLIDKGVMAEAASLAP